MNVKVLPNNAAKAIRATYIDQDTGFPVPADEYVYEFDLTGVPADGQFHLLTKPVASPLFNQNAFNFDAADDGVNNRVCGSLRHVVNDDNREILSLINHEVTR